MMMTSFKMFSIMSPGEKIRPILERTIQHLSLGPRDAEVTEIKISVYMWNIYPVRLLSVVMVYQTGRIRKIWLVLCWRQRRNSLSQLEEGRGSWTSKFLHHFPVPASCFSLLPHIPISLGSCHYRFFAPWFPRFPVNSQFPRLRFHCQYRQNIHKSCVLAEFTHHINPWLLMSCNTFSASLNSG